LKHIINKHPNDTHPLGKSLQSNDTTTTSGVIHRELLDAKHTEVLLRYMVPIMQEHHISSEKLEKRKKLLKSLKNPNIPLTLSPYPRNSTTQKGNFAEIFLAEYLQSTTDTQLPIYRLRYNPNPDQSMKGDDVLLFDLDSKPARIIVGEAKFRKIPSGEAVVETTEGLVRSYNIGLPISLMFVAERLFEEGNEELGNKVMECVILFASDKLKIEYVGLLMSNKNSRNHVNRHTTNELRHLLMISLGMENPESIVKDAFDRLEAEL